MMMVRIAMNRIWILFALLMIVPYTGITQENTNAVIQLPKPQKSGGASFVELLWKRQSLRSYKDETPGWDKIGQILWAAQGINRTETGGRTVPSAWGAYPLELYVIRPDGVFHYVPKDHTVVKVTNGNIWDDLENAGLGHSIVHRSPCTFIITADFKRLIDKCETIGDTERYIYLEAGHAAQNIIMQAIASGMGGVPIGANITLEGQQVIGIPAAEKPVYIVATGIAAQ